MGPWGYVYAGGSDGAMRAFDYSRSGPPLWTSPTGGAIASPPTACSSTRTLFVGSDDKSLYAFDALNGTALWAAPTGGVVRSSPALDTNCSVVYVGSSDSTFYAFSAATGALLWKYLTVAAITSSPSVSADGTLVFVGVSTSIDLIAFDTATHEPAWQVPSEAGGGVVSSPSIGADGTVFVGTRSGRFFASTRTAPNNVLWSVQLDGPVSASATIGADGTLYVGTEAGTLYALSPADGRTLWSLALGEPITTAAAIAADGRLFLPSFKTAALFVIAFNAVPSPRVSPAPAQPTNSGSSLSPGLVSVIALSVALPLLGLACAAWWRFGWTASARTKSVTFAATGSAVETSPLLRMTTKTKPEGDNLARAYSFLGKHPLQDADLASE